MKIRSYLALILALSSINAWGAGLEKRNEQGIAYASGGVGVDEREALKALAPDYNLKLVFADRDGGHFLSDIRVSIKPVKGEKLLETVADGPWFFAKLPPGSYVVTAGSGQAEQARKVTVAGKGRSTLHFYWQ